MTGEMLLIAFGVVVVALVFWLKVWPKYADRIPHGKWVGLKVNGKSRSVGVDFDDAGFMFPLAPGHVNAMAYGGAKPSKSITLRYRITADPNVQFIARERGVPGEITILLQRNGDDYSAIGEKEFYRLYAPNRAVLTPGEHEIAFDLTAPGWTGVEGPSTPGHMVDVLINLRAIHIGFGALGGVAHGVYATGAARFDILELSVL